MRSRLGTSLRGMRAAGGGERGTHEPSPTFGRLGQVPFSGNEPFSIAGGYELSRKAREADDRLLGRAAQTRSWAAPLPDLTVLPRVGEAPRIRMEWETRDTLNHRLWADTMATGPKAVTSAMLAEHPTAGAESMMPSAARHDHRYYGEADAMAMGGGGCGTGMLAGMAPIGAPMRPAAGGVASGLPGMLERPGIPRAGAWYDPSQMETVNAIRDVRGVIRENNGGRADDVAARIQERTFQNQWFTPETLSTVVDARLRAAEELRSKQDDWRSSPRI